MISRFSMRCLKPGLAGLMLCATLDSAVAQVRLDRADPSITEQALPKPVAPPSQPTIPMAPAPKALLEGRARLAPQSADAIVVDGSADVAAASYRTATSNFVGRVLSADDLTRLAGAVAATARAAGFPFATASIQPQPTNGGTLHVTVDEGRIDAVRVLGVTHAYADRLLTRVLATGRPVRQHDLERAIMLVSDLPGITIKESKYVRQDGFGILLVTLAQDRAIGYAQIDNRGSAEVGPVRSTLLGSLRDVVASGDELGLLASNTPLQPSEFGFVRARYGAPIDASGSILSASASYGRANPGASLKQLNVVGHSVDTALALSRPLIRTRDRSLWAGAELRFLQSDQTLLGRMLRDDHLATFAGSLNGTATLAGGAVRGDATVTAGLPLDGVTHEGDRLASRRDGDARFVTVGYSVEWVGKLSPAFTLALASAGQVASRPLLASAEIGMGGPVFGRGYDYAERTGDSGILGSAELRADLRSGLPRFIDRVQIYGFIDGGHVDNLRDGFGGGSLVSSGFGARAGRGPLDGMLELAFPLNADRLSSGTRSPRVSFRLSRVF